MPTVKLHPEGWLSLPADVRRRLGVESGEMLEVQVVGNSAILRRATGKAVSAEPEAAVPEETASPAEPERPAVEEPAPDAEPELPITAPETPAPAKRRGRPPKAKP